MIIYLYLAVILTLVAQINTKYLTLPVVILLFVVSAIRADTVGIDFMGFKVAYLYEISTYPIGADLLSKYEFGWIILNRFVKTYFDNFEVVIYICSFLTIFPLYKIAKKESLSAQFSILLYFLLFYYCISFSLIRQSVAMSFFVLSVYHYDKDNKKYFLLFLFLASMFHYSVLALFPILYFANKVTLKYKMVSILVIGTLVFGFLGIGDAMRKLIELLPFQKYAHYADYKEDVTVSRVNLYAFLVPKNFICLMIYRYLPNKHNTYKNLFLAGIIIGNLFISIALVSRVVLYLFIFELILLPNVIYFSKRKYRVKLSIIIYVYALVYFIYNLMTNRAGVIPYSVF